MPIHDWRCFTSDCPEHIDDLYQPRLAVAPPICPIHATPMERIWSKGRSSKPFESITVEGFDGHDVTLTSLGALRNFEAESIRRGQPQIFRNFSQDQSNKDVNTLGRREEQRIPIHSKRGVPFITPGPRIQIDPRDLE